MVGKWNTKFGLVSLWRQASILTSAFNISIVVIWLDQPRWQNKISCVCGEEKQVWEPITHTTTKSKKIKKKIRWNLPGIPHTSFLMSKVDDIKFTTRGSVPAWMKASMCSVGPAVRLDNTHKLSFFICRCVDSRNDVIAMTSSPLCIAWVPYSSGPLAMFPEKIFFKINGRHLIESFGVRWDT